MEKIYILEQPKSKIIAILLCLFFGGFGVHHFYLGNNGRGVLYILFSWTGIPFVLSIIDIFIILFNPRLK